MKEKEIIKRIRKISEIETRLQQHISNDTNGGNIDYLLVDVVKDSNTITLTKDYVRIEVYDSTHGLSLSEVFNYSKNGRVLTMPKYKYTVKYKIIGYNEV